MSEKFSSWTINPKQKKIRTTKSLSTKLESFLGKWVDMFVQMKGHAFLQMEKVKKKTLTNYKQKFFSKAYFH